MKTIQLDNSTSSQDAGVNLFLVDQNAAYPEPSAKSGGVSFPSIAHFKRFVMATSVVALGTSPTSTTTMTPLRGVTFVFPATPDVMPTETTAERYERRRKEIVASGIPLLGDDEIRAEIKDRRGDS